MEGHAGSQNFAKREVTSRAICLNQYNWLDNQKFQPPCLVSAYLSSACNNGDWTTVALPNPTVHYTPPGIMGQPLNPCQCSWAVYNTIQACAFCQGVNYDSAVQPWDTWSASCKGNSLSAPLPWPQAISIPNTTSIPFWAVKDPTTWENRIFNAPAANVLADANRSDITDRNLVPPIHKGRIGAIVGASVGAVVLIAAAALLLLRHRQRKRQRHVDLLETPPRRLQYELVPDIDHPGGFFGDTTSAPLLGGAQSAPSSERRLSQGSSIVSFPTPVPVTPSVASISAVTTVRQVISPYRLPTTVTFPDGSSSSGAGSSGSGNPFFTVTNPNNNTLGLALGSSSNPNTPNGKRANPNDALTNPFDVTSRSGEGAEHADPPPSYSPIHEAASTSTNPVNAPATASSQNSDRTLLAPANANTRAGGDLGGLGTGPPTTASADLGGHLIGTSGEGGGESQGLLEDVDLGPARFQP